MAANKKGKQKGQGKIEGSMHYTTPQTKVDFCSTVDNNISHLLLMFRFIIAKMLGGKIITGKLRMKTPKEKMGLYGTCFAYASLLSQVKKVGKKQLAKNNDSHISS